MKKAFRIKAGKVQPCPRCGNTTDFIANSERAAEDCCDCWISCTCGYAPDQEHRREDVWGSLDAANVSLLMQDWNQHHRGNANELNESRRTE